MTDTIRAGTAYFATMFAAGFILGTARVLLVAPRLGEMVATVVELPLMLVISWFGCGWCIRRWRVAAEPAARLRMGVVALAFLFAAEFLLGLTAFGRSSSEQFQAMVTGAGLLGLLAQLGAGVFPLLRPLGIHRSPS